MEEIEKQISNFIREIRKYPTSAIAKSFSYMERKVFNISDNSEPLKMEFGNVFSKQSIYIMPWLFPEIVYYSSFSNEYRANKFSDNQLKHIYGLYHNISMTKEELFVKNNKELDRNPLTYILYGISQQQFIFQKTLTYLNRFSRIFYLLSNVDIDGVTLSDITEELFNTNAQDYVEHLVLLMGLSINNVSLNLCDAFNTINNQELMLKIFDYFSIDIHECRETELQSNIFKVKPILQLESGEYIAPSASLMFYNTSDNIYWLFKDKFYGSVKFVHRFGEIFEDYVYEILKKQYGKFVQQIPRVENQKSADFYIESQKYNYLVEVKSGVAKLDAKCATLNQKSLDNFIANNITDAMEQLDASAKIYNHKTIIPIIINYDVLFVEDSLLSNIDTYYKPNNYDIDNLLLFGIDKFEDLILTYDNVIKLDELIDNNISVSSNQVGLKIYKLIEKTIVKNNHFYKNIIDIKNSTLIK